MQIPDSNTLAVLPFVNRSGEEGMDHICDGITEEIIHSLARIEGLKVTSRTSSFYFKGRNLPVSDIGAQLGVSTLLEGSVRIDQQRIRITAQLIDVENDVQFWSESWNKSTQNLFDVQEEIAHYIAEKLREHFGHFIIEQMNSSHQTPEWEVYALYLKGRYYFNRWNPEDVRVGISFFDEALQLNPGFAKALVGKADAYSFLATIGILPFEEGWSICRSLTEKALHLDPKLPIAHYQMANVAFFTGVDFKEAVRCCQKAIEISPNHVESHQFLSLLYALAQKFKRARKHLQIVRSIDPLSQEMRFYSGLIHYYAHEFAKALIELDACLALNPKNIPAHLVKALCLIHLEKYMEAIDYMDSLPSALVVWDDKLGVQAIAYALLNDKLNKTSSLNKLKERALQEDGYTADAYLYMYYAMTQQEEQAMDWLRKRIQSPSPLLLLRFSDPAIQSLYQNREYLTFQEKLFPNSHVDPQRSDKKKPLFDLEAQQTHLMRLKEFIHQSEVYLDPELSLRSLADQMELTPNQLSWLLNEGLGLHFNAFINQYRIDRFKHKAKAPENKHLNILALALECGFNSKTVFNTYFKKETGLTPSQYLNQLRGE